MNIGRWLSRWNFKPRYIFEGVNFSDLVSCFLHCRNNLISDAIATDISKCAGKPTGYGTSTTCQ